LLIEPGTETGLARGRAISTKSPFQVEPGAENPVAESSMIALAFGPALRNAIEPTVGAFPRKRTVESEVVFLKAAPPIDKTLLGITMDVNELAPSKA
jgi:hypothetical protein